MRRLRDFSALLAGAALLSGCRVGGWRDVPELAPYGDQVEIETSFGPFAGELLLVTDDGVVVLRDLAHEVPWSAVRKIRFDRFPYGDFEGDGRPPEETRRRVIAHASRYPEGLTEEQLVRLFEAVGHDEVGAPQGEADTREGSAPPRSRPLDSAAREFIEAVRDAASRFEDRRHAQRAGYRRIGPDFPGMGEHWVNPSRAMASSIDPREPAILSYAVRDGDPVLLGVAFAVPLGPNDHPPSTPFRPAVWHDHSGAVDEEVLLLNHPASVDMGGDGHRLAVVHVWTGLANPDGVLAQNNWALPFWREGLPAPERPTAAAARGVSLANTGRAYYRNLIGRAARLEEAEGESVAAALDRAASAAEAEIERHRAAEPAAKIDPARFEAIWVSFWREVRAGVSAGTWDSLRTLAAPVES